MAAPRVEAAASTYNTHVQTIRCGVLLPTMNAWADGGGDLESLGRTVARVDRALADFEHPDMHRPHVWDLRNGPDVPALDHLPHQVIHNDANEHNVLVGDDGRVAGLIDFGDLCRAPRVCGLAVAAAYAKTALAVPERELLQLVAGYHEIAPLAPEELALLPDLIRTRLATSVAMAALQRAEQPDNDYLLISQQGVSALLDSGVLRAVR